MQTTGTLTTVAPGIVRLVAPNPSPMTFHGTNTYLLGDDPLIIIDPGPADDAHLRAIHRHVAGRNVADIVVTHSHLDHSPGAAALSQSYDAPIVAFGDSNAGKSTIMQELATQGLTGGGEGMDWCFAPDICLADGGTVSAGGVALSAIHTPGHIGNHLCLRWDKTVFSGDHVMGWSTSLVSPPDGDMTDFIASCHKLLTVDADVYFPGHGDQIVDPHQRVRDLITHRLGRSDRIRETLSAVGPMTLQALTERVYADVAPALFPAAARNLFAHLVDLHQEGAVVATPLLSVDATFALSSG